MDNWNIEVDEISGSPDYTAKFPFGTSSSLGEIKFGEPISNAVLKLREEDGTGTVHSMTIGNGGYFYLGFIGTDDLRNGLVNTGGFNIDNMGVYIKINTLSNNDCELMIGYQESA